MNEAELTMMLAECTTYSLDIAAAIARFRGDICKVNVDADVRWSGHPARMRPCVECKAPVCEAHGTVCNMCNAHCCRECFDAKKGMTHVRIAQRSESVYLCRIHVAQCHPTCTEIAILGKGDYEEAGRCIKCKRIPCLLHSAYDTVAGHVVCVGCCGVCAECLEPLSVTPSGYIWRVGGRDVCLECRNELRARSKRARVETAKRYS